MKKISIRNQLFILVAAVALPMLALLVYTISSNAEQNMEHAKMSTKRLSIVAASDVARVLEANRDMLAQMAKRPLIKAVDAKQCDSVLWDFKQLFPKSANMTTIDLDGIAICSAVPQPGGKPVNVYKAEWFQRSLKEKNFVVGKPFFGPITGRWVTVLTYPIKDDDGNLKGLLGLPMDLAYYKPNLSAVPLRPNTTVGVITSEMVYVWRSIEPEKFVGKSGRDVDAVRKMVSVKNGEFIGIGADGVKRLYSVTPVAGVDWYAYSGIPIEPIHDEEMAEILNEAALAAFGLICFIVFALLIARRIERPIRELAAVANEVKSGKTDVRVNIVGAPEIMQVANEFNEMLDVRLKIEKEMEKSEQALKQINENLQSIIEDELRKSRAKDAILIKQARLAAIGEMIGNIAHQWRQPLSSLMAAKDLIVMDYFDNALSKESMVEYSEQTSQTLKYLSKTIDDFRHFFKSSKEKEPFDIIAALKAASSIAMPSLNYRNIKLVFEPKEEQLYTIGFESEFQQVIINIIGNAKDAIIANQANGKIVIKVEKKGDFIRTTVEDNGGGIPQSVMDKIFDPYFTTKFKSQGTGLGLYMAKTIIETNMHGRISVANGEHGAIFTVELPTKEHENDR